MLLHGAYPYVYLAACTGLMSGLARVMSSACRENSTVVSWSLPHPESETDHLTAPLPAGGKTIT